MGREAGGVDIGARLRAARERRGLTVLQSAEKLHVDARLLEALEAGDFGPLGADVYVRGHLRRYAELIGESGTDLQALYSGTTPASTPDLTRIPRAAHNPESSRLLLPGLVAVVALALAGVVWWLLSLPHPKAHPLPEPTTQPLPAGASTSPGGEADAPAPVPNLADPSAEAPASAAAVSAAAAPRRPAAGGQARLAMKFSAASWVKVWDAHGEALLDGLMASGTARAVDGAPPLRIVLGNAQAVTLELNGRPLRLDGMVRRRGDAHITVDAVGQVSATPSGGREE